MILLLSTALIVPVMLMVGGLVVDLPNLMLLRDRLQVASDAAALAAASRYAFVKDVPTCVANCRGNWATDPGIATQYAQANFTGAPHVVLDASVPKVTVTLTSHIDTTFLRLIGFTRLPTSATASAIRANVAQTDMDAEPTTPGRSRLTR